MSRDAEEKSHPHHEYRIDKDEETIYQTFWGKFSVDDLQKAVFEISSDANFNPDYNVLADLGECELEFVPSDMKIFFEGFKDRWGSRTGKSAILVNTANETALAMWHQRNTVNVREVQVFCTEEAAIGWLKGEA
jgi:hypothetical protein